MRSLEAKDTKTRPTATVTVLNLRDALAVRWINPRDTPINDPLRGIPTSTVIETLGKQVQSMDGIELSYVSFTLARMGEREVIPPPLQTICDSIIKAIRKRQREERGRPFPVRRVK